MTSLSKMAVALSLVVGLLCMPAVALATTNLTYGISGVEYAATDGVGSFAGVAWASDDAGTWQTTVVHGPLPTAVGHSAAITGGSFAVNGAVRDMAGGINGGSIKLLTTSTCGRQTYKVAGHLVLTSGGSGDADFATVLTHYRIFLFGRCITVSATVRGGVTFHLP